MPERRIWWYCCRLDSEDSGRLHWQVRGAAIAAVTHRRWHSQPDPRRFSNAALLQQVNDPADRRQRPGRQGMVVGDGTQSVPQVAADTACRRAASTTTSSGAVQDDRHRRAAGAGRHR